MRFIAAIFFIHLSIFTICFGQSSPQFDLPSSVRMIIKSHCLECHNADVTEGEVRLDTLQELSLDARLELLNKAQDQIFFGLMPPNQATQPNSDDRKVLAAFLRAELQAHNASKLDEKLSYPSYGNYVDHDELFSGEHNTAGYSSGRRWLVSPQIFHQRVMDVFQLTGRERESFAIRNFHGVTNPFILPDHSGVRDYSISTLDGGHLLVMLKNAQWIASKQIFAAENKGKDRNAIVYPNPKDRWFPQITPLEFEEIITSDSAPTESQLLAAINKQFSLVLQRPPNVEEQNKYLDLLRSTTTLAGNTEGLRQMLVAVLLESEFLYRLEFGRPEQDEHGRQKLTPQEAAFAISYALGDRGPDEALLEAANQGRLETKDDYQREVQRLLLDTEYYRGQIDSSLNGKHYQSDVVSHPKIIRFFREFFGYTGALKVFKDIKRSDGKYQNPGRGTHGTPGWLTYEADRIVTWHVEKDVDVFNSLLTSDKFFVYYNMPNEQGQTLQREWREVYEHLKDTPWKTEPERVLEENLEFLKERKTMRIVDTSRPGELVNYMHFFAESYGQNRNPFTRIPWSHGYSYHHSPFYSLPPTPSIYRYGSWKSTRYEGDRIEVKQFWDYPTEQPFAIENRKGILTHPAWLIAHSTNFHADPIRRGRWIREKLLAGRVPDVPITVDAQVPEDAAHTFRERVEMVTHKTECWKCHRQMNPLGFAFEMFDDFGRFRQVEKLEHPDNLIKTGDGKSTFDVFKTAPVVTTGALKGTGVEELDGEVGDALELIDRLAQSDRVRQSIIRHAFRYYMGRNETLVDSKTLIDADQAYLDSNGSFRAVIVSLLTSDSFMYRK